MTSPKRMPQGRIVHSGGSLQRTWGVLVTLVLCLVVLEFRFMWNQMDSSASHTDVDSVQETLQAGYSYSGARHFHLALRSGTRGEQGAVPGKDPSSQENAKAHDENLPVSAGQKSGQAAQQGLGQGLGVAEPANPGGYNSDQGKAASGPIIGERQLGFLKKLGIASHNKWIVVDATSGDCKGTVSTPAGWRTLVTGHSGELTGCNLPSCQTLGPGSNSTGAWGEEAAWWKNMAFLAALLHGAQLILDADCSVSLNEALKVLKFGALGKEHGMMYNETLLFNPYAHFGAWGASPRAVAGSEDGAVRNSRLYYIRDLDRTVVVKHALSEGSPDIVTHTQSGPASGTSFDRAAPPVFVGQRSFWLAIPTCSLYRREAAWALLLPCTSHSLRCHVLRHLLAQTLLRQLDAFSGFYQLRATSAGARWPEAQTAFHAFDLLTFLDAWKCDRSLTFFQCMSKLVDDVFQKGSFINQYEQSLMKSWITAIQKTVGVVEPKRTSSWWQGVRKFQEVRMTFGSLQSQLELGGSRMEQNLRHLCAEQVMSSCNGSSDGVSWFPISQWRKPLIKEVVLIVVFNSNRFFWNNVPFLETMHRPFFKHIVYCVPDVDQILTGSENKDFPYLTMVEGQSDQWYLMYECLTTAARMNIQGVRGFLQIGDDTLLNTWLLFNMPRDSMWMPFGFTTERAEESSHRWGWYWWSKSRGRPAVLQTLADLERTSGLTSQQLLRLDPNFNKTRQSPKHRTPTTFSDLFKNGQPKFPPMRPPLPGAELWEQPSKQDALKFLTNYYSANRLSGLMSHRAMDLFYIPQVLIDSFVKFSRYFMNHGVIIELAVPTIHYGLAPRSDVKYVTGTSLWEEDRSITYSFYSNSTFFLHPFKIKANMGQKKSQELFCKIHMKTLFSEMLRHVKR